MKKIKCCKTMSWTTDFYYTTQTEDHIASLDTPGFCCMFIYIKYN